MELSPITHLISDEHVTDNMKISIPTSRFKDKLIWTGGAMNGDYIVKSGYKSAKNLRLIKEILLVGLQILLSLA